MALSDYEYSISGDFPNQKVDITILQDEIISNTGITEQLNHIDANIDEDTCTIYFETALTSAEETVLNSIVAAHTGELSDGKTSGDSDADIGDSGPSDICFVYGDQYDDYFIYFKHTDYKVGTQLIFRGTDVLGSPKGVKAILKGNGQLRLYDKTNRQILFEWINIEQADWDIFSFKDIEWPSGEAILELQGRETSEKDHNLYCSCFMICFVGNVTNLFPSGGSS